MSKSVAVILVWAAFACTPQAVFAGDLALTWSAPRDCPDREQWRAGLSQRVGRTVTLDSAAALSVWAQVELRESGYELDLRTRSRAGTERRKLQARSCSELARASLLIAALLLTPEAEPAATSATVVEPTGAVLPSQSQRQPRPWFFALEARVIGDLGSLAAVSVGPGFGLGLGLSATRFTLGGFLFPARDIRLQGAADRGATLRLMAASASVCQEFFHGPTLGPCAQFELGRLLGTGDQLAEPGAASALWLVPALGVRGSVRLFGAVFGSAHAWLGAPLIRPTFAVRSLGTVFDVPAVVGRLELSVEARL